MMTIDEYLQILPNFTFGSNTILRALGRWDIKSGELAFQRDKNGIEAREWVRKRDLAEADMWESASGLANLSGGTRKLESRSITDKSFQISAADRLAWSKRANSLRDSWGMGDGADIQDVTLNWGMDR